MWDICGLPFLFDLYRPLMAWPPSGPLYGQRTWINKSDHSHVVVQRTWLKGPGRVWASWPNTGFWKGMGGGGGGSG